MGQPYKGLLISERAIGTQQGQKYVYVVDDKNEVGVSAGHAWAPASGQLRIVAEGLKPTTA